jgi:hypothetical protein
LLKLVDQSVLKVQFRQLLSKGIQEDLMEDSQSSPVQLRCPRFRGFLAGDAIVRHALKTDMDKEFLKRYAGARSSLVC